MDPSEDAAPSPMRIGRSGRLEAAALEVAGDHALLVQETGSAGRRRALLTTDKLATGERLVVMPLDDDVEVRVDGDALAVWLGSGVLGEVPREHVAVSSHAAVPPWASIIGGGLLLLVIGFAVIGSAVFFSWLARLFG